MRGAAHISSDGPGNIEAACRVAISERARNQGVLAVLDDTVHAASRVRKMHSTAVSAFRSPDGGPVGGLVEGHVWLRPTRNRIGPLPSADNAARVPLLETFLGDDGSLLRLVSSDSPSG